MLILKCMFFESVSNNHVHTELAVSQQTRPSPRLVRRQVDCGAIPQVGEIHGRAGLRVLRSLHTRQEIVRYFLQITFPICSQVVYSVGLCPPTP